MCSLVFTVRCTSYVPKGCLNHQETSSLICNISAVVNSSPHENTPYSTWRVGWRHNQSMCVLISSIHTVDFSIRVSCWLQATDCPKIYSESNRLHTKSPPFQERWMLSVRCCGSSSTVTIFSRFWNNIRLSLFLENQSLTQLFTATDCIRGFNPVVVVFQLCIDADSVPTKSRQTCSLQWLIQSHL